MLFIIGTVLRQGERSLKGVSDLSSVPWTGSGLFVFKFEIVLSGEFENQGAFHFQGTPGGGPLLLESLDRIFPDPECGFLLEAAVVET